METTADKARAIVWAVLLHVAVVTIMYLGVLWSRPMQAPSVRGGVVEAVLVTSLPSAAQPARRQPRETAPPPQPKPEPRPQQAPTPPQPEAQSEPPRPDLVERERAARVAEQREAEERAQREEQERRRQEQVLLEQQRQQEAEQRERLRRQQEQQRELEEIRRQREEAERERKLAQERLEQIADQRRASQAERTVPEQPPAEQLGNQGTDDSLLGRYVVAIQQAVERSWIRPETIRPGQPCEIRIVQIPGGEVISATVQPSCRYDELGKRSVEAAVLRAQPLPYTGFESVFRREIIFTFRAPEG